MRSEDAERSLLVIVSWQGGGMIVAQPDYESAMHAYASAQEIAPNAFLLVREIPYPLGIARALAMHVRRSVAHVEKTFDISDGVVVRAPRPIANKPLAASKVLHRLLDDIEDRGVQVLAS